MYMLIGYKIKSSVTIVNSGVFCWELPEKLEAYLAGNPKNERCTNEQLDTLYL